MKIEITDEILAAAIDEWFNKTNFNKANIFNTDIVAKTLKNNLKKIKHWKNKSRGKGSPIIDSKELNIIKKVKSTYKHVILLPGFLESGEMFGIKLFVNGSWIDTAPSLVDEKNPYYNDMIKIIELVNEARNSK